MNAPSSTDQIPYVEFRIVLYKRTADGIEARVVESPAGQSGRVTLAAPIEAWEIDEAFATIASFSQYIKRSTSRQLRDPVPSIGQRLYNALIDGEVGYIYRGSLDRARGMGRRLRLRFVFEDPALATLPVEFLYGERDYLALSRLTAIVRRSRADAELPAPGATPPLKVLLTAGETPDEMGALTSMIGKTPFLQLADLLQSPTPEQVSQALAHHQPHILHVCSFVSWSFRSTDLDREVTDLFAESVPSLLFLNTKHTDSLAYSLSSLMPAVIGLRGDMTAGSRTAFAEGVYTALGRGVPLESAVTEGRQTIDRSQPGSFEWTLPVFYLQAATGDLLSVPGQTEMYEKAAVKASAPPGATKSSRERQRLESKLRLLEEQLEEQRAATARQSGDSSQDANSAPQDQILQDIEREIEAVKAELARLAD